VATFPLNLQQGGARTNAQPKWLAMQAGTDNVEKSQVSQHGSD